MSRKNFKQALLSFGIAFFLFPQSALSDETDFAFPGNKHVEVQLLFDRTTLQPGTTPGERAGRMGVRFLVSPGWHIYWRNSGEAALPTRAELQLPEGWSQSALRWPVPEKFIEQGNIRTLGYSNEVLLLADIYPPQIDFRETQEAKFTAEVSWLVCKHICVPGKATLSESIEFATDAPLTPSQHFPIFERFDALTPISANASAEQFDQKEIRIQPLIPIESTKGIIGGLRLVLPRGNVGGDIANHLQLFPYESDALEVGTPRLKELSSSELLITFPITKHNANADWSEVSGALVLSPEVSGHSKLVAIEWNAKDAKEQLSIDATSTDTQELTYRVLKLGTDDDGDFSEKPFETRFMQLALAVLAGFIAGMILNFMPCVLPIISIKVMSFLGKHGESSSTARLSALSFASGILSSFLVLAVFVVSLRAAGTSFGWGFQFQNINYVFLLTLVIFVLSLGFFDLYSIRLRVSGLEKKANVATSPIAKQFFEGILVTALSTPCTAPFLGSALAVAFTQPPWVTIVIFLSIGAGLATPYLYLSTHPALLSRLPAPGMWTVRLRQCMGMLLLATAVWLLHVLQSLNPNGLVPALTLFLLLFFVISARTWQAESGAKGVRKLLGSFLLLALTLYGAITLWPKITTTHSSTRELQNTLIPWSAYSEEVVENARAEGKVVFITFTAEWCITCKANEKLIIETQSIHEAIQDLNVVPVKADWTDGKTEITQALSSYGGHGVPYYVVLSPKKDLAPMAFDTLISQNGLIDAFRRATN